MQIKKWLLILVAAIFCFSTYLQAQAPPFYNEIQAFKKQDSLHFPPANAILFVGSSSFRMWKDVQQAFPGATIINRGFGGSQTLDVIRYADDIIFPYHPKQIVFYIGENDIAASADITTDIVVERIRALINLVRTKLPGVPIVYVSIKPSISRQALMPKMVAANEKIKKFIRSKKNAEFVNIYDDMLNSNGQPRADIFLEDNLHMNAKGYAIWQKEIGPFLKSK